MKTKRNYIVGMLLAVAALVGFTACMNDDPHEGENGVTIALDNSRCPNVSIGHTYLYIYDTGGNLRAAYDYADAYAVASALLPLEAGHYTVATVINADKSPTETTTLTALHEWVAAQIGIDSDLLSGIAEMDVAENRVVRVAIPLSQDAFSLPVLSVRFTMPETGMGNFTPLQTKTRAAAAGYTLRCVAELYKAGTDQIVLHKAVTPELQEDGTYKVDLQLSEGSYDLCLWADYAHTEAPLADAFYHTESLKAVNIFTEPYTGDTDDKDAAYGNENGITLPKAGATITLPLQRPLAKSQIIANDVETYKILMELEPDKYPPLEELTVTVKYEGYFPSEFNALKNIVTDATMGIAFSTMLSHIDLGETELPLVSDWIMASKESSVTVTLTVSDRNGNKVSSVNGITIAYKQGCLTTITGKFLTAGVNVGGINIDSDWDEIIIEF